jgi:hypothetical protein
LEEHQPIRIVGPGRRQWQAQKPEQAGDLPWSQCRVFPLVLSAKAKELAN